MTCIGNRMSRLQRHLSPTIMTWLAAGALDFRIGVNGGYYCPSHPWYSLATSMASSDRHTFPRGVVACRGPLPQLGGCPRSWGSYRVTTRQGTRGEVVHVAKNPVSALLVMSRGAIPWRIYGCPCHSRRRRTRYKGPGVNQSVHSDFQGRVM